MVCAYCGKEAKGTKEHIVSCAILDLFPECYITFDETRNRIHESDPMVKDVCADCNNNRISYIDSYAKDFIAKYFIQTYSENDRVEIEYDYVMIQKVLLKYAYNDMRSHKEDCSFFDEEIKQFLMNSNLEISYVFRFNSVQFLLLCWDKESNKIEQNRTVLQQCRQTMKQSRKP